MDSGMVRGIAFNCHQLQPRAQECSDKMTGAIAGVSDYWVDLGGEEFKQHCTDWIGKMNKFKAAIALIESEMMKYADKLQGAEQAAAAAAAAASKTKGKTK